MIGENLEDPTRPILVRALGVFPPPAKPTGNLRTPNMSNPPVLGDLVHHRRPETEIRRVVPASNACVHSEARRSHCRAGFGTVRRAPAAGRSAGQVPRATLDSRWGYHEVASPDEVLSR